MALFAWLLHAQAEELAVQPIDIATNESVKP
jgi:hypothetical protein